MDSSPANLSRAVSHSFQNRTEIERSQACACFHCFAHFAPSEIRLWTDSDNPRDKDPGALRPDTDPFRGMTAICPQCEYDSVIGSASGYELSDAFLRLLHENWHITKRGA
jgi:hypothetical protein